MNPLATRLPLLTAALAAGLLLAAAAAAGDFADPEAAVEAGRQALGDQWDLNWYDDPSDGFKPIDTRRQEYDWSWLSWVGDFFQWLGAFSLGFDFATVLRVLAWLAIIALAAWLIYTIVRTYQRMEIHSADAPQPEEEARTHVERVEALPVAVERRVEDLLAEARRLRSAGDLTMAVVYLYSHQLVVLDRAGLLRLVKGKTNRQYLRELRNASPPDGLAATLRETMLLFERAFFGAHPPNAASLDRCFAATQPLEAAAWGDAT